MSDLGEPTKLIGIEIIRNRTKGIILLRQRSFVEAPIARFNLANAREVYTPTIQRES